MVKEVIHLSIALMLAIVLKNLIKGFLPAAAQGYLA